MLGFPVCLLIVHIVSKIRPIVVVVSRDSWPGSVVGKASEEGRGGTTSILAYPVVLGSSPSCCCPGGGLSSVRLLDWSRGGKLDLTVQSVVVNLVLAGFTVPGAGLGFGWSGLTSGGSGDLLRGLQVSSHCCWV